MQSASYPDNLVPYNPMLETWRRATRAEAAGGLERLSNCARSCSWYGRHSSTGFLSLSSLFGNGFLFILHLWQCGGLQSDRFPGYSCSSAASVFYISYRICPASGEAQPAPDTGQPLPHASKGIFFAPQGSSFQCDVGSLAGTRMG